VRLLHAVAFSKKLPWFEPIKVFTLKTQLHEVNARWLTELGATLRNNFFVRIVLDVEFLPTKQKEDHKGVPSPLCNKP